MDLEEYKKRAMDEEDWAPGWDAIDESFNKLYEGQVPEHFGTTLNTRAIFGGENYIDGYSIYTSKNGYKHIVTYGLTELYTDEESFGGEFSKWGYELTAKLAVERTDECMWLIDMMNNLARYTFTTGKWFEEYQYISGNNTSINKNIDTAITALVIVNDTELEDIDTIHGKVQYMQLVGITERELEIIKEDREQINILIKKMKVDNPNLVINMARTKSYI